ncbi:hypothetical protein [Micromonospora pisi]|uniref:hypothetical protein n=1 Tax=Micromonospora pisi TaxID=589240 RepID=UPI001B873610|nr:hypothetical protein [Micromonospora pisi]
MAVHEVLYDEAACYVRHDEVLSGGIERARDVGLWLTIKGSTTSVDRLPGRAAYPRDRGTARLFTLSPGQVGRYRANFRFTFTQCACNPSWFYEDWVVHVGNGPVEPDGFIHREPDHDADLVTSAATAPAWAEPVNAATVTGIPGNRLVRRSPRGPVQVGVLQFLHGRTPV